MPPVSFNLVRGALCLRQAPSLSHSFLRPLSLAPHTLSTSATQLRVCRSVFPVSPSSSPAALPSSFSTFVSSRSLSAFLPLSPAPSVLAVTESSVLPRCFSRSFAVRQRKHRETSSGSLAKRDPSSPTTPEHHGSHQQAFPAGSEGLSLGWQLFVAFASSIFFYFGFVMVMRLLGGQRVAAIHVDQYGRPVDPSTGSPY
ncbi:putative transmembrane protein [Toxoplasma gondii TgCatPRC2]|uniref:Putative transmembrane protein n=1 Tax=Toxoplasma gondii TgCatPRC2 TaxID=1130821 RepID=A0A151HFR3_TOXGO|nr:putative transmembrane protein [Toxoplasma gondii TgCatPRC2]